MLIAFNLLASANNQAPEILEKEVGEQNYNISIECSLNYDINLNDSAEATIYIDILNNNEHALRLKSLLIKVVEVPGNITNVEVESPLYTGPYLFSWDNVPGNQSERLQRFLRDYLDISWAKNATIHKSDDNKTIYIVKDENSAEIILDEKKEKAILKIISDGRIFDLNVREMDGKNLKLYWWSFTKCNCSSPSECIQNVKRREYFNYVKSNEKSWNKYFYVAIDRNLLPHKVTHLYVSYSTDNIVRDPIVRDPKDVTKYLYVPPQRFDNVWVEISEYEYWFSWEDNVPGNDNESLLKFLWDDLNIGLAENAEIHKSDGGNTIRIFKDRHLFSWENVPGNDSERLLKFLLENLDISWAENAEIHKSDDGKTIRISKYENSAEIILDEKKENAILKISDGEPINLKVKKENSKQLNIYCSRKLANITLYEKKENAILNLSDGRLLNLKVRDKGDKLKIDRPCICSQTKSYNILINLPQDRYHYSQLKSIPHPYPDVTSVRGNSPTLSWHFTPDNRNSTRLLIPAYQIQKDKYMIALDNFAFIALTLGFISIFFAVYGYKRKRILIGIFFVIYAAIIILFWPSYFKELIACDLELAKSSIKEVLSLP